MRSNASAAKCPRPSRTSKPPWTTYCPHSQMEVLPVPATQSQLVDPEVLPVRADRKLKRIPLPNGAFRKEHCDFLGRVHVAEEPGGKRLFCKYDVEGKLREVRDGSALLVRYSQQPDGFAAHTAETETTVCLDDAQKPRELVTRVRQLEWRIAFEWSKEGAPPGLLY